MSDLFNCLVDIRNYDVGCLAPAIVIIAVLSFMEKRVRLKPDLCNGRPGLPVPVDFLGDQRNRFIIPFAFGATAASSLDVFLEISPASEELQQSAWANAFREIFMTLLYGIINYPYLACLNAKYKIIGYSMGLIYSFIRLVVDLVEYFGCTVADEQRKQMYEKLNLKYVLYVKILADIPVVVCTLILVGSYAMLLYKEIKTLHVQGIAGFRYIRPKEETTTIKLAGVTERAHVNLLFSNQLHKAGERAPNQNGAWYNSVKNRIYVRRPDFKFSTQFLSSFIVSCIFVYQLTVRMLVGYTSHKTYQKAVSVSRGEAGKWYEIYFQMVLDYFIKSVVIACLFTTLQLCFFLRSHRKDVLKTYRTRKDLVPDEILHPKMLVGRSLRFCGYQIAFAAIGLLINTLSAFFLLFPISVLQLLLNLNVITTDQVFIWVKEFTLSILPYVFTPILVWISMLLLSLFVFRDHTFPDISITVNNRRLFGIMSYFFFFFNILVGLWSGVFRIVKGAVMGLVFLPRIDRTTMMKGYRKFDRAYMAYVGFLSVLVAFRHPVMLCFAQLLLEGVDRRRQGQNSVACRPRVSTRALNRWFLTVLLMRNPSLLRYRKQDVLPIVKVLSASNVLLKLSASGLGDESLPEERLKRLHVF